MGRFRVPLRICKDMLIYWRSISIILIPLAFCPLPIAFAGSERSRAINCAYTVLVMASYWILELVPIPITALLPVFMFPLLGVLSVGDTSAPYLSASNFLFFGGLIIALAIEEVNLHKRIALRVLLMMGSEPRWIMFGFMAITWFLSMWMSNTATTAMMLPIALAVIDELITYRHGARESIEMGARGPVSTLTRPTPSPVTALRNGHNNPAYKVDPDENVFDPSMKKAAAPPSVRPTQNVANWSKEDKSIAKGILLCLCYSANIGGTGTLTGTVPNVVAFGQLQKSQIDDVTYTNWMAFQLPASALFLMISFLWLQLMFIPLKELCKCSRNENSGLTDVLRRQYIQLGSMKFGEYVVTILYVILVTLWIFREPRFVAGWGSLFSEKFVKDAVPAILIAVILFALPKDRPDFFCWRQSKMSDPKLRAPLLTWNSMKRFPWDVILLLGGGFALAKGVESSGLSKLLACTLRTSLGSSVSPAVFCAIMVIIVTFLTEVTSNTSTATIFIPILISVAIAMDVHPLYFVTPVAVACSFAFMLPVATPPNAIVFGSGLISTKDMMLTGIILNFMGIAIALLNVNFYTPYIFDLSVQALNFTVVNDSEC